MPGINLRIVNSPELQDRSSKTAAQDRVVGLLPHLQTTDEHPLPTIMIRLFTHNGYRVWSRSFGDWKVYCESSNANRETEIMSKLKGALTGQRLTDTEAERLQKAILAIAPGSLFLVAVNQVSEQVFFMNDNLARLPIYITVSEAQFVLARDINFMLDANPGLVPNPLYLALNTVFSYVPGHGTVYDEIDTLQAGTIGLYEAKTGVLTLRDDPEARFIEQDHSGKRRARLNRLLESFAGANKRISYSANPVIALSGGFDSRAVIASMHAQKIGFDAVTYQDAENTAQEDPRIAGLIAAKLGCPHSLVTMSRIEDIHYEKLFAIKAGINYLGVAHFLQFLEELTQAYPGGYTLVTGDGGDKVMPSLVPQDAGKSESELLECIFKNNGLIEHRTACSMFGVPSEQMEAYLRGLVSKYPVANNVDRYKCFLLAERGGRWLFEGEDRNRFYGGMETPFYDYEFYREAMRIPDQWKSDRTFYRDFLVSLTPELSAIKIANGLLKPSQIGYGLISQVLDLLRRQDWLRRVRQRQKQGTLRFYSQDHLIGEIMRIQGLPGTETMISGGKGVLSDAWLRSLNRSQLNTLYTVFRVMERSV